MSISPMTSVAPISAPSDPHARRILLRPKTGWQAVNFVELWQYRGLLWILAMRDVKVRYKQAALGAAWAIIQPLANMLLFTIIFARLAKLPTGGVQPQLFYFTGMLPWQLFAYSLAQAGNSLISNQNLITKVYFPRLVIPIAAVITGLIDFAIAFGVLLIMMAWYHAVPGPQILLLPVFVLLAFLAALAVGLWLSALNVEFRDIRYVIPFLIQFWMFATPVVYPSDLIENPIKRMILGINPLSGVVEGFRWCILGKPTPGPMLIVSIATILVLLIGGLAYFRRMEKGFADLV